MKYLSPVWIVFYLISTGGIAVHRAAADNKSGSIAQLTVRGEASLNVPADQIRLNIGVVTSGPTVEAALEQNTVKMKKVENALISIGLIEKEYRTGHFQIQPEWSPRPRQADPDLRPQIVGYTAANTLRVKTRKINLAGKIIDASTQAGANRIESIVFGIADPRKFRSKAIAAATDNARADALSLAMAAGVGLGFIHSLKLESAAEIPRRIDSVGLRRAVMAKVDSAPILIPGDVTVSASVIIVYQIIHLK